MDSNANYSIGSKLSSYRRLDFENTDEQLEKYDSMNEGNENDPLSSMGDKDLDEIHSSIPKELIPEFDMEFDTEELAYDFYLTYAKLVGFGIRRSKSHNDKIGNLISRTFCCSAEGKRRNDKRDAAVRAPRPETRFGCLAKLKVNSRQTGKFRVTQFVREHNHYLSSPSKTHLHRCHRKITSSQAFEIQMADSVGIQPKTSHELMARQAGGRENVGFIPEDYRNYLRSKRTRDVKIGDTGGVLEYLQKMQFEDPNFFYAIQVDEDDLITNIFWADAKMRADYMNFGDVVCFDTTYRKNNEGRPFALFVGVNHHKQTIVFGAALLYDETSLTFEWLFDTFARAMSEKTPKTILTDQDAAMAKALVSRWPQTHHRLCIWHIYQNAANHLSGVFTEFKDFSNDFSSCIYDFEEEEDFINAWKTMLDKYDLHNNHWLRRMFELKEKWALVYGRQIFCADMTTTQRSESMNSVIKRYVSYKHKFLQFFNHFERLIEDRRYEELKADFRASISMPILPFPVEILKHAVSIYTPEVFKCFQIEWYKSHDSSIINCGEVGSITTYEITPYQKSYHHTVVYDSSNDKADCSCRKFEFAGILCSHVLKVFSIRNITRIPSEYILKRWTRKAKTGYFRVVDSSCNTSNLDPKVISSMRYKELCRLYIQLVTRASETEDTYEIAKEGLLKMLEMVDARLQGEEVPSQNLNRKKIPMEQNEISISEENRIKIKGIKMKKKTVSGKRLKSGLEKALKRKRSTNKRRSPTKFKITSNVPIMEYQRLDDTQIQQPINNQGTISLVVPINQQFYSSMQSSQVAHSNAIMQNCVDPCSSKELPQRSMSMMELLEAQKSHDFESLILNNSEQSLSLNSLEQHADIDKTISDSGANCNDKCSSSSPCLSIFCGCKMKRTRDI